MHTWEVFCFLILKGKCPVRYGKKFNRKILQYGESLVDFHTSNSNNQCNNDKKKKDDLEARAGDRFITICVKISSISETLLL